MRWTFRKQRNVDVKIFNLGFSKAGTTSFEHAMEHLGYKTYHGHYELPHNNYLMALWIHRDHTEIRRMTRYWDAFADAPRGGTDLYRQLYEWYPDAKYVQTVREPQTWHESLTKMLCKFSNGNLESAIETQPIWVRLFYGGEFRHSVAGWRQAEDHRPISTPQRQRG